MLKLIILRLQQLAFVRIEDEIRHYVDAKKALRNEIIDCARRAGTLMECPICCDDELVQEDFVTCRDGHRICFSCVRRYISRPSIAFRDLKLEPPLRQVSHFYRHCEELFSVATIHITCPSVSCTAEYSLTDLKVMRQADSGHAPANKKCAQFSSLVPFTACSQIVRIQYSCQTAPGRRSPQSRNSRSFFSLSHLSLIPFFVVTKRFTFHLLFFRSRIMPVLRLLRSPTRRRKGVSVPQSGMREDVVSALSRNEPRAPQVRRELNGNALENIR